jgi:hypothetical protein
MLLSGIKALDDCIFEGHGIPPGSLIEIYGHSDSGKNSLALTLCREFLAKNFYPGEEQYAAWVCAETNLSMTQIQWAKIDWTNLLVAKQHPLAPALELAREYVDAGCGLVVVDSVSALISSSVDEPLSKVIGTGLPLLKASLQREGAVGILLNQDRALMPGRSTQHSGSCPVLVKLVDCRIRLASGAGLYRGPSLEGIRIHFKLAKNGSNLSRWGAEGKFSCYWRGGLKDVRGYRLKEEVDGFNL